jgi:hypothetical protein
MDLLIYDPPLPELPLLRGLRATAAGEALRFDWASFVIRLAKAVAERRGDGGHPAA